MARWQTGRTGGTDGNGPGIQRRAGAAAVVKRLLFLGFVAGLGIQRLFELRLSRRNEQQIRQRGGLTRTGTYHWIVALHAAWFAAMLLEVFAGRRKFRPG